MSKLSFRARQLDPAKPMPIYLAEELPDLPEYSAINRAVPQMPSGMEKEEESEHHLQRAICAGLLIPTPEVTTIEDEEFYDRVFPADYKMPRQLIHMQPLGMDQDIPDYDMDSADECFVEQQSQRLDLDVMKFEQMMDKLEKSSGQTVVTLNEAKALLKQDDEVSIAVYDYWLNKRLTTQHPLILSVKTENRGNMAPNNPYLAFRRRTEKMQTRKNRKNDETSYEKMLKLRRDLSRAVTILDRVKQREIAKRSNVQTTVDIFEKRFAVKDYSGQIIAEIMANMTKSSRSTCAPLYGNQYPHGSPLSPNMPWTSNQTQSHHYNSTGFGSSVNKYHQDGSGGLTGIGGTTSNSSSRKEKRQYKKRKHKLQQKEKGGTSGSALHHHHHHHHPHHHHHNSGATGYASGTSGSHHSLLHHPHAGSGTIEPMMSSDEDDFNGNNAPGSESEDEGLYAFKRNRNCNYHKPISDGFGNWPWVGRHENGKADKKYRFTLTSIRHPRPRCIGFARRRMGRGGRIALDRCATSIDDIWSSLDYTIFDSERDNNLATVTASALTAMMATTTTTTTNIAEIPIQLPPVATHLTQLTAGRVTGVRLSSATSDGTASPLSSYVTPRLSVIESSSAASSNQHQHHLTPSASASTSSDVVMTIKEEQLDDYERLIDNVRSNNKAITVGGGGGSGSSGSNSGINSSSSGNLLVSNSSSSSIINRHLNTPAMVSRGGSFSADYECVINSSSSCSGNVVKHEPRLSTDQVPTTQTESRDSGISVKSEMPASSSTTTTTTDTPTSITAMTDLAMGSMGGGGGRGSTGDVINIDDFLHDVGQTWLHFRPKSPISPPPSSPLVSADEFSGDFAAEQEAMTKLLNMAPFNVELQCLDTLPRNLFADDTDTTFVTSEPLSIDTLLMDDTGKLASSDGKENAEEANTSSGDSMNELSLNLTDANDDNEKLLANILEECQMEDSKVLSQTSNFWNGLLEDNLLPAAIDLDTETESKFDRTIGYTSELLSTCSRSSSNTATNTTAAGAAATSIDPKTPRRNSSRQTYHAGHSHFKITSHLPLITKRTASEQRRTSELMNVMSTISSSGGTAIKQESMDVTEEQLTTSHGVPIPVVAANAITAAVEPLTSAAATAASTTTTMMTGIKIKSEPMDTLDIPKTQNVVLLTQQPHARLLSQPPHHQQHAVTTTQISSADATASHDYAASPHHQVVQIIGQATTATAIRTPQQKLQAFGDATAVFPTGTVRQMNGPAVLQNLLRHASYQPQHKNQKPDDVNSILTAENAKLKHITKADAANHNPAQPSSHHHHQQQQYGIIHQNTLAPQIAIIGSAQSSQGGPNRIFLTSQPSTSTVDGKLHINTSAGAHGQQITTLTSIPNAAIIVDGGSANATGKATVIDAKNRLKYVDPENKQRILYATNFKGNRGAQLLTSKVVNIVPIHGTTKNNIISAAAAAAASSGQTPQTATVLRNKATGDLIQRVGTINNAQNIRPSNNGGSKVVGMVTATAPPGDTAKLLATDNTVPGINTTTR